jgi:hypothetical protein
VLFLLAASSHNRKSLNNIYFGEIPERMEQSKPSPSASQLPSSPEEQASPPVCGMGAVVGVNVDAGTPPALYNPTVSDASLPVIVESSPEGPSPDYKDQVRAGPGAITQRADRPGIQYVNSPASIKNTGESAPGSDDLREHSSSGDKITVSSSTDVEDGGGAIDVETAAAPPREQPSPKHRPYRPSNPTVSVSGTVDQTAIALAVDDGAIQVAEPQDPTKRHRREKQSREKQSRRRFCVLAGLVMTAVVVVGVVASIAGLCWSGSCSRSITRGSGTEQLGLAQVPLVPSPTSQASVSQAPTASPTSSTLAPTEQCVFNVTADCVLLDPNLGSSHTCDGYTAFVFHPGSCSGERPLNLTMLFNGGDCFQSDRIFNFTCDDFSGGPPVALGSLAHVRVTDAVGNGIAYFDGTVEVGDFYVIGDGINTIDPEVRIIISSPDRRKLYQTVQLDTSCAPSLPVNQFLLNRFGASQVSEFYTKLGGLGSAFATFSYSAFVDLPIMAEGDIVTVTSLVAETNFAGTFNLTDQVAGVVTPSNGTVLVTLSGEVDTSAARNYSIDLHAEGIRHGYGTFCLGGGSYSFTIGGTPADYP